MDLDQFKLDQHLARAKALYAKDYVRGENKKKIFYHWSELGGWRFYLKAIRHRDWRSLRSHIRATIKLQFESYE
jgi:hypothetical protein